ncbi:MAG: PIN domain-containing protein [Chitinispirillia bacterium]|nr:PIN domain-containing protein [Chitinispirillia bacterium]MCL2242834.1 PIN domain-containing protein [Chitinispirillia bacterium]
MIVFIDTNLIVDYLADRGAFAEAAELIFGKCSDGTLSGYVSSNAISDVFYILRKEFTVEQRKKMLFNLCRLVRVTGLEHEDVVSAITNEEFKDLEDCLQSECAGKIGADYIITRNIDDFIASVIPAITPSDFLRLL